MITFAWDVSSAAGSCNATGTLEGDVLTVRFNTLMQMSDFENAIYTVVP